jgi:hypothetical protein
MTPGENIPGAPEMAPWKKSSLTIRRTERRVVDGQEMAYDL